MLHLLPCRNVTLLILNDNDNNSNIFGHHYMARTVHAVPKTTSCNHAAHYNITKTTNLCYKVIAAKKTWNCNQSSNTNLPIERLDISITCSISTGIIIQCSQCRYAIRWASGKWPLTVESCNKLDGIWWEALYLLLLNYILSGCDLDLLTPFCPQ